MISAAPLGSHPSEERESTQVPPPENYSCAPSPNVGAVLHAHCYNPKAGPDVAATPVIYIDSSSQTFSGLLFLELFLPVSRCVETKAVESLKASKINTTNTSFRISKMFNKKVLKV